MNIYDGNEFSLWKKEDDNSKNWGSYGCGYNLGITTNCKWFEKEVFYYEAYSDFDMNCGGGIY